MQYLSLVLAFVGSKIKNDDIAKVVNALLTVTSGQPLVLTPSVNGRKVKVTIELPAS